MLGDNAPQETNESPARNMWRYGSIILAVVGVFVAWIVLSRWQENRLLVEQAAREKAAKDRSDAEKTIESLGGNEFKIISFYIMPAPIHRGESTQLCYGVSNAKSVKLDPPVADVWPSVNRCFEISPKKNTTYTLTAEDASGNTKAASVTLEVH